MWKTSKLKSTHFVEGCQLNLTFAISDVVAKPCPIWELAQLIETSMSNRQPDAQIPNANSVNDTLLVSQWSTPMCLEPFVWWTLIFALLKSTAQVCAKDSLWGMDSKRLHQNAYNLYIVVHRCISYIHTHTHAYTKTDRFFRQINLSMQIIWHVFD